MIQRKLPPFAAALSAVTDALSECGINALRFSPSSWFLRLDYQCDDDTVAGVNFDDELIFVAKLPDEVRALIASHAQLATFSPEPIHALAGESRESY